LNYKSFKIFLVPIVPDGNAYQNPNHSKTLHINSQAGAWELENNLLFKDKELIELAGTKEN